MKNNIDNTFSDIEVISKLNIENKSEYFEILYKRYYKKVLNKCYYLVKSRNIVIELTEDIFSKVFEKLPSFNSEDAAKMRLKRARSRVLNLYIEKYLND